MEAENFDERFGAIISKMDNHRMQINGMNKDLLRLVQKATKDFGGAGLDTAVTENKALKEQVNGLKTRVEELEDENKRLGNDYARLSKDHSRLDKDYAILQDDLHDADKKNRELEEKLSESEQTLSQFMALSSRVASANLSHKRVAEDDWPTQSKKTRHSYEAPSKDFHQDDRSHLERSRYDTHMDSISRREFRDYSPSQRPVHDSLGELRSRDEIYSNSSNAQGKVSNYLARLPTPADTRDDVSSLERNKTPLSAEDINIRGKASIHNGEKGIS
jgi:chromosome segregation ATPase